MRTSQQLKPLRRPQREAHHDVGSRKFVSGNISPGGENRFNLAEHRVRTVTDRADDFLMSISVVTIDCLPNCRVNGTGSRAFREVQPVEIGGAIL